MGDRDDHESDRSVASQGIWYVSALLAVAALVLTFREGLAFMVEYWDREEYSHAWLIPFISMFLIWQKKDALAAAMSDRQDGSGAGARQLETAARWGGFAVILGGLAVGVLGELSTIYLVIQYGFLAAVFGIALVVVGWRGFWLIWAPLIYLVFVIPLPDFLYANLSAELQLISSQLGVAFVRFFDIPVFLEGNIIDLGIYKLQVVEACSGLRYLFPLMSFGFLCAYLYQGPVWQRLLLFISTIPITILMNSFRIGLIGVLVDRWGIEQAEGALHFFEGWVIFMACVFILFCEVWLFVRLSGRGRTLAGSFQLNVPKFGGGRRLALPAMVKPRPWFASVVLLFIAAAGSLAIGERVDLTPDRQPLAAFPLQFGDWQGRRQGLPRDIVDTLKVTDYMLADYANSGQKMPVNLYVAYYGSQRKGEAVHSPRSCIPGDGWQIESLTQKSLADIHVQNGKAMVVNRVIIAKGDIRQVVYYWFAQRGRSLTNEYLVKWYLFWDGMTRRRTDGALVRLVTPLRKGEELQQAERRLGALLQRINPIIDRYIPA